MRTKSLSRPALFLLLALMLGGTDWAEHPSPVEGRDDYLVMSVLWYQRSAEMRALCYQAFHLARLRLEGDARMNKGTKKRAVVVDIDETVLNNSPQMAKMVQANESFPYGWKEWVDRAEAQPLPGAVEFLTDAVAQGYDVFYVSNRSAQTETEGTVANLKKRGFPQVVPEHVLLKQEVSSKESRRALIQRTHEIVLLLGDNLNDMDAMFEHKSMEERSAVTDSVEALFGSRFIVLPNPMYGDWESAVYGYRRGLTEQERSAARRSALMPF